eukprot:TRINITY_DN6792_c0_g1_i2.p1 TRINITY_DN6792_c0_g1~~TRINITY_DN6792_c0_g1_i2.p1  ORF type:complete len:261 (-),score=39.09 TRINITY_DN6792_c0_g1_i2:191-910(-)
METVPLTAPGPFVKNAAREVRIGFVRKVYSILSVQLLMTVAIAGPICMQGNVWAKRHQPILMASFALMMVSMCAMMCCQKSLRSFPTNYVFLLIMTVATSIMVGFSSAMYTWQSVALCAGLTAAIFVGMTIYACCTTTDFTGFGPYFVGAMLSLLFFGFALMIMSACGIDIKWGMMVYDVAGVLIFTLFIVYDTQLILGELGGHKIQFSIDDYCFAALNLYLDIINLFLHLLSLLGDRN